MFVTELCAERGENLSGFDTELYAVLRENWSVGRYSVFCWVRGEIERWAIRNERKILPSLKTSTMNTAPVTTSSRAMIPQLL